MIDLTGLLQLIGLILGGVLYLLAGYRTVRFAAKLESALLLLALGVLACRDVDNRVVVVAVAAGLAVVGWLLGNLYYYLHVAVAGAMAGLVIAWGGCVALGGTLGWATGIGGALAGALATILFQRPLVIFGTSAIGALCLTLALRRPPRIEEMTWKSVTLFALMTLLGCLFQARTTRKLPARRPAPSGP